MRSIDPHRRGAHPSDHFRPGGASSGEIPAGAQVARALERAAEMGKDGIDPEDMKSMRSSAAPLR